jgi:hypothetical protein
MHLSEKTHKCIFIKFHALVFWQKRDSFRDIRSKLMLNVLFNSVNFSLPFLAE